MKTEKNITCDTFVDIHDIDDVNSNDYDVLIMNVDNNMLYNEISHFIDISYLKKILKKKQIK